HWRGRRGSAEGGALSRQAVLAPSPPPRFACCPPPRTVAEQGRGDHESGEVTLQRSTSRSDPNGNRQRQDAARHYVDLPTHQVRWSAARPLSRRPPEPGRAGGK